MIDNIRKEENKETYGTSSSCKENQAGQLTRSPSYWAEGKWPNSNVGHELDIGLIPSQPLVEDFTSSEASKNHSPAKKETESLFAAVSAAASDVISRFVFRDKSFLWWCAFQLLGESAVGTVVPDSSAATQTSADLQPLVTLDDACPHLIGAADTVDHICNHINSFIAYETNTYFRKTVAFISRCRGGGKTTILQLLHQRLRAAGMNVLTVTFSGAAGFLNVEEESSVESLFRVITNQLDFGIDTQAQRVVDWEQLDSYIGNAPFVLLIDEIHALNTVTGGDLTYILHRYFIDKVNRYLVVTSHLSFLEDSAEGLKDCSGWSYTSRALSERPLKLIPMPTCTDIKRLRQMHNTACAWITESSAAFYGYLPSLMYAASMQRENPPLIRSPNTVQGASSDLPELFEFVAALVTGLPSSCLRCFMCFAYATEAARACPQVRWPPCHMTHILRQYPEREPYGQITAWIDELGCACNTAGDYVVWKLFVRIAILLRFILASSNGWWEPPFGLCRPEEARGAHVAVQHLGPGISTPEQAKGTIHDRRLDFLINTMVLYVSTEVTHQQFDGYCVRYQAGEVCNVCAYKVQDSGHCADEAVPAWITRGGHLLRSDAPGRCKYTIQSAKRWTYYDADDTDAFLGCSLRVLQ